MKDLGKKRCKSCREWFQPKLASQDYCTKTCKNREGQKRLRERARIGMDTIKRLGA